MKNPIRFVFKLSNFITYTFIPIFDKNSLGGFIGGKFSNLIIELNYYFTIPK